VSLYVRSQKPQKGPNVPVGNDRKMNDDQHKLSPEKETAYSEVSVQTTAGGRRSVQYIKAKMGVIRYVVS
jgi:hypothetical protein